MATSSSSHDHNESQGKAGDHHIGWNPNDPHGFHEHEEHGHHILSARMLGGVLAILLLLTGLTVFLSQAEAAIADALNITIPQWVNVAVAMSIASVKGIVVALFFMQLLYDNKLNLMIMAFCLLVFGIFLGFTAIDMTGRERITRFKADIPSDGGTGIERPQMDGMGNVLYTRSYLDGDRRLAFIYSDLSRELSRVVLSEEGEQTFTPIARWDAEASVYAEPDSGDTVAEDLDALSERFDLGDYRLRLSIIRENISGPISLVMNDPELSGRRIGFDAAAKISKKRESAEAERRIPSANSAGDTSGNRLFGND